MPLARVSALRLLVCLLLVAPLLLVATSSSAAGNRTPAANWETLSTSGSTVTVAGWAFDPDRPSATVTIHVYVDGAFEATLAADGSRPDVGAAFGGIGDAHGFRYSTALSAGTHSVCAYAIDADLSWANTPLGCRSVGVSVTPPVANWEVLSASGTTVSLAGWAVDPDQPSAAVAVHAYVDGRFGAVLTADGSRPDVGAAFAGAGPAHGFSHSVSLAPGVHSVCLYAIDVDASWRNTPLGCRSVAVALAVPVANWEVLSASGATITVAGWAFDPDDTTASVPVHVYVDGAGAALRADATRPDVGAAFGGIGDAHGFSYSAQLAPGAHTVCVYAIDVHDPSRNTALGCRTIAVRATLPRASLDVVSATRGTLSVQGWALDPDDPTTPVSVHVYVDGSGTVLQADGSRPDVGAAFPGSGDAHGFSFSRQLSPGIHSVCVYAIDVGVPWRNTALGCRSVAVGTSLPMGEWEYTGTSVERRSLWVTGWALDLDDRTAPVTVEVYVDGVGEETLADQSRTDIATRFPGAGPAHVFWHEVAIEESGVHEVCVFAIDLEDPARDTPLGCEYVEMELTPPVGAWEAVSVEPETLTVSGWALDPDRPTAQLQVEVWAGDRVATVLTAGLDRPDVGAAHPGAGNAHGFSGSATRLEPQNYRVCVFAKDTQTWGPGTSLGCRDVVVPPHPPEEQIRRAWVASGSGSGPLGDPLGAAQGGLVGGGYRQEFEHGAIYWSQNYGAQVVPSGPIRDGWVLRGAEAGPLGYPRAAQLCNQAAPRVPRDGCSQLFHGGDMYVSGAHPPSALLPGAIRVQWYIRGGDVWIGYPTQDPRCGLVDGGCVQQFENGLFAWSPATGAWDVQGPVATAWLAEGGESGPLGYPVTRTVMNYQTGEMTGTFQHGRIVARPADGNGPSSYQVIMN
ncbi:LGFP repeat-containing protein [Blastococcus sp. SYSU D00669]